MVIGAQFDFKRRLLLPTYQDDADQVDFEVRWSCKGSKPSKDILLLNI